MAITDAQYNFFTVLKNCHKDDPSWKVLTWICQPINAEILRDDIDLEHFEIYKDGGILFKGDYETLLANLFEYIF